MLVLKFSIVLLAFVIWEMSIVKRKMPKGLLEWLITTLAISIMVSEISFVMMQ